MFLHQRLGVYEQRRKIAANDRPEIRETSDLVQAILDLDTRWDGQRGGHKIEQRKEREIKQGLQTDHVPPPSSALIQLTPG